MTLPAWFGSSFSVNLGDGGNDDLVFLSRTPIIPGMMAVILSKYVFWTDEFNNGQ